MQTDDNVCCLSQADGTDSVRQFMAVITAARVSCSAWSQSALLHHRLGINIPLYAALFIGAVVVLLYYFKRPLSRNNMLLVVRH